MLKKEDAPPLLKLKLLKLCEGREEEDDLGGWGASGSSRGEALAWGAGAAKRWRGRPKWLLAGGALGGKEEEDEEEGEWDEEEEELAFVRGAGGNLDDPPAAPAAGAAPASDLPSPFKSWLGRPWVALGASYCPWRGGLVV